MKLGLGLTKPQEENVWQVLGAYDSVLTDVPGKSNVIQHQITLTNSTLIRSKPGMWKRKLEAINFLWMRKHFDEKG